MRAEDLINKCIEGRAARDVIQSLEEDLPDARSIRSNLLKDLKLAGVSLNPRDVTVEDTCIKVETHKQITEEYRIVLMSVCDTYSRTYPELNVLVSRPTDKPKIEHE